MSATGKPLGLLWRKWRDFVGAAFGKPGGDLHTFPHSLEESAGPHAAPNDQPTNPVSEVENSVDNFDLGRRFQKDSGVKLRKFKHVSPSLPTRQTQAGPLSLSKVLTGGKGQTGRNAPKFLNVPKCAELTHVKSLKRLPANENWHPLEAA